MNRRSFVQSLLALAGSPLLGNLPTPPVQGLACGLSFADMHPSPHWRNWSARYEPIDEAQLLEKVRNATQVSIHVDWFGGDDESP